MKPPDDPLDGFEIDLAPAVPGVDPQAAQQTASEEGAALIAEVSGFFQLLNKSLKQIGLYRHNVAGYRQYLGPAYAALHKVVEQAGSIPLLVEQTGFRYLGQLVYQEQASELNLAFKFYRDGVRLLRFRQGLTEQELLDFILICLTNFQSLEFAQEDMVSLMWKRNFDHLEHVVMDTFALGAESTEQTQIEVDQIVDHLYRTMSTRTRDSLAFARLSVDDLDIEIKEIEQIAGLAIRGEPASPTDQIRFQHEAEEDLKQGNMRRLTAVLFRLFAEDLDTKLAEALPAVYTQLLDGFLLQDNLAAVEWLLDNLQAVLKQQVPAGSLALAQHILGHLGARMCDPERVDRLGEFLDVAVRPEQLAQVASYLARLSPRALGPLVAVLERLTRPEARALVCDRLAGYGPDHLDTYVNRLQTNKANFVRDLLSIIDRLQPPNKTQILAGLLAHPNLAIRIEALTSIGDGNDLAGSAHVMKALRDPDAQVRTTAARLLPNFDPGVALRSLLEIAKEPTFEDKPDREQAAVFCSLAMLNVPPAIEYLRGELHATGLLQKKHLAIRKRNIISGIASSGSITAYQLLRAELQQGVKDKELSQLMERACARLKDRLLAGGGDSHGQ
jgi:hypothetical protein